MTAVTHASSSLCHLNLTPCQICQHLHAEEERGAGILGPKMQFLTDSEHAEQENSFNLQLPLAKRGPS